MKKTETWRSLSVSVGLCQVIVGHQEDRDLEVAASDMDESKMSRAFGDRRDVNIIR